MTRVVSISTYTVYVAACSQGFNEWRSNIIIKTTDPTTMCDLRFVDNVTSVQQLEQVNENGVSQVYLPFTQFSSFLQYLQTEKPLSLALYGSSKRVLVQTSAEAPGQREVSS
jgi:hypothetical protein